MSSRYAPFVAASAAMDTPARDPATARRGTGAFQAIASYIFGGNKGGQKIAMTTPVLTTSDDRMRFMMPSAYAAPEALPVPSNQAVQVEAVPGAMYAARAFNGVADEAACAAQLQQLKVVGIAARCCAMLGNTCCCCCTPSAHASIYLMRGMRISTSLSLHRQASWGMGMRMVTRGRWLGTTTRAPRPHSGAMRCCCL